jgi:hypothetical protein
MIRTSFYEAATRVPVSESYQGGPPTAHRSHSTRWKASQTRVVAAMIEAALSEHPPRRLLLESDAYHLVTHALQERLSTFERQKAVRSRPTLTRAKTYHDHFGALLKFGRGCLRPSTSSNRISLSISSPHFKGCFLMALADLLPNFLIFRYNQSSKRTNRRLPEEDDQEDPGCGACSQLEHVVMEPGHARSR